MTVLSLLIMEDVLLMLAVRQYVEVLLIHLSRLEVQVELALVMEDHLMEEEMAEVEELVFVETAFYQILKYVMTIIPDLEMDVLVIA